MLNVSIARRYARALLAVATEEASVDAVLAPLETLAKAFETMPELNEVFVNPAVSRAQREGIVESLLAQVGAKVTALVNLVKLLNQRGRMGQLPMIARQYRDMADEREGRLRGKLVSAVPLAADSVDRLTQTLEKSTQKKVVLETHVDPYVLGGVATQLGPLLLDGTLRQQLESLRRTLKQG